MASNNYPDPNFNTALMKGFQNLRQKDALTDFKLTSLRSADPLDTLWTGDDLPDDPMEDGDYVDVVTHNVHKSVLAALSTYFNDLFTSPSGKLDEDPFKMPPPKHVIRVKDDEAFIAMSSQALKQLVQYLYHGSIVFMKNTNYAIEMINIGHFLGIKGIQKPCIDFMVDHLTVLNCAELYRFAQMNMSYPEFQDLHSKALSAMCENFREVINTVGFFALREWQIAVFIMKPQIHPDVTACEKVEACIQYLLYHQDTEHYQSLDYVDSIFGRFDRSLVDTPLLEQCSPRYLRILLKKHGKLLKSAAYSIKEAMKKIKVDDSAHANCPVCKVTKVIVAGGDPDRDCFILEDLEDLSKITDLSKIPETVNMNGSSVCKVDDGLFVTGGKKFKKGVATPRGTNLAMKYSIETGNWAESTTLPCSLYDHGSYSSNGKVYIFGGRTGKTQNTKTFKLSDEKWSPAPDLPNPVNRPLVTGNSTKIFVLDGLKEVSDTEACIQILDVLRETWSVVEIPQHISPLDEMGEFNITFGAVAVATEEKLYILGGIYNVYVEYQVDDKAWVLNKFSKFFQFRGSAIIRRNDVYVIGADEEEKSLFMYVFNVKSGKEKVRRYKLSKKAMINIDAFILS